jgi:Ca2+-binding EF-hand superfamily protein
MRESTESLLAELVAGCYRGENAVESFRITLCEAFDFCPSHFFSLVTSGTFINSRELQQFLQAHGVTSSSDEIFMVIKQFSNLQDGRLSYEDFLQVFLPSTNLPLRERVQSRKLIRTFDEKTLEKFVKVLAEEINYQVQIEQRKQVLYAEDDFTVYAAFESLAHGKNWLDEHDLTEFMKRFQKGFSIDDYEAFLRRTDLEADGIVNYKEFLDFIMPFNLPASRERKSNEPSQSFKDQSLSSVKTPERPSKNQENIESSILKNEEKPSKSSEKPSESPKIPEKRTQKNEEIKSESEEDLKNDEDHQLALEILELLIAVKTEETHRQNLAVLGELPAKVILKLVTENNYPDSFKNNFKTEDDQKLIEAVFQILAPMDTEYQLNVVSEGQNHPGILEHLAKLALDSFIQVQDLIFQVLKRFKECATEEEENFDSKIIVNQLNNIQVYLVERDLNLLLNRLDLTD